MTQCVLLLMPATSYRARDFLEAARRLGVAVVVGSNHRQVLEAFSQGATLTLDFEPIEAGVARIVAHTRHTPISAVIGTDEETCVLAAAAAEALALPHNSRESVAAAHDKHRFRLALTRAGILSPWFKLVSLQEDPGAAAEAASYPCVLKPIGLSASRGVIRADDRAGFLAARSRIAAILRGPDGAATPCHADSILVEAFIPGAEVALEGLLQDGRLKLLALFDKPDPLDGPFFEETIYVTPSRLPEARRREILARTAEAAEALGLREGPIHAELRLNERGVWMIELAARSIGGLCSRVLSFGQGLSLEELILKQVLGLPVTGLEREDRAAGVMMIPIPAAGRLTAVAGLEAARAVVGIEEVVVSIPLGERLVPLPEGDRYLGFIFARAGTPGKVELALRDAHRCLDFRIEPERP